MRKLLVIMVAALVVAAGIGFVVRRSDGGSASAGAGTDGTPAGPFASSSEVEEPETMKVLDSGDQSARSTLSGTHVTAEAAAPGQGQAAPGDIYTAPSGGVGPRVIKTAYLSVEVGKDGFQGAFDSAWNVARKYGGFVASSSSSGEKSRAGELLIRVPAESFDLAMRDLRGLGEVDSESVDGQEVTDQFVDLNARLRSWEAQQRVLLRLMDKASTIAESMAVQREIQQVQAQIEQIKGQLRMLRDQTSYGTIQLALHEPGAVAPKPATETPSLTDAWAKAWAGFLSIVALVIIGLGYLIPLSAIALIAWLVVRRTRARAVVTS